VTALTAAKNIARGIGLPIPQTLVSNQNQDARRILQCLNDAGRYLSLSPWNATVAEATISTTGGGIYNMPSDFRALVPTTIWKLSQTEPVRGPIRWIDWQALQYGIGSLGIWDRWHFRYVDGDEKIFIDPVPSTGEEFRYLYFRDGWVKSGSSFVASVSADTDIFLINEYLVETEARWRMLRALGQPYGEEKQEAKDLRDRLLAEDGGMSVITAGYADHDIRFNIPDTGFGSP